MKKKIKSKGILMTGNVRATLYSVKTGKKVFTTGWHKNKFVQAGRIAIMRNLKNEGAVANEGQITYLAVGTGVAAVLDGDTQLSTELTRAEITSAGKTRTTTTNTYSVSFASAEANGTITEIGACGEDAAAGLNTGTLFERSLFESSFTKTTAYTLTVEVQIPCNES